jgi:hypothetical protein
VTEREIEVEGRELVITADGRVKRSPVPDAFSPVMFRHIVAAIDVLYRRNGMIPSVTEVCKDWEGFDHKTVKKAYASPELKKALALRGIELDMKDGLTPEQLYALTILQDPSDRRSTKARLEAVGIPVGRYRAWMRNPLFSAAMNQQAEHNLGDAVQVALNRLVGNVEAGDQRAIEKVLEMTGRWNPQAQEIQNARSVVLTFMEALQKHAPPEVLQAVLTDVSAKMQTVTIVQGLKELS